MIRKITEGDRWKFTEYPLISSHYIRDCTGNISVDIRLVKRQSLLFLIRTFTGTLYQTAAGTWSVNTRKCAARLSNSH